jgi:hypothetical protein
MKPWTESGRLYLPVKENTEITIVISTLNEKKLKMCTWKCFHVDRQHCTILLLVLLLRHYS